MTQQSRFVVKLLFLALLVSEPFKWMVIAKYGEPYPAIMMPGFRGTQQDRNGDIRIESVRGRVVFRDGQVIWILPSQLLEEVPSSHHLPIVLHMFGPQAAPDAGVASRASAGSLMTRLFPGRAFARNQAETKDADPETRAWLRDRVARLYPLREPDYITFVWYRSVFSMEGTSQPSVEQFAAREVALR